MSPEEIKNFYRSNYNFAKSTGMSASSLHNWLKWGFVPEGQQCKLEMLTNGALKAQLKSQG